jgi:hypothetical protein
LGNASALLKKPKKLKLATFAVSLAFADNSYKGGGGKKT